MTSAAQELYTLLTTPPPPSTTHHPPITNPETIKHNALQTLRDTGDPTYLFLRTLLELTSVLPPSSPPNSNSNSESRQREEILFHCVSGLRHVFLWGWGSGTKHSPSLRTAVRDFLWALGIQTLRSNTHPATTTTTTTTIAPLVSKTVANVCLATAASFWKRGWNEIPPPHLPPVGTPGRETELRLLASLVPGVPLSGDGVGSGVGGGLGAGVGVGVGVGVGAGHPLLSVHRFTTAREVLQAVTTLVSHAGRGGQGGDERTTGDGAITASVPLLGHQQRASAAIRFLAVLVGEFSGWGKGAARYRLPQTFHRDARTVFLNGGGSDGTTVTGGAVGLGEVLSIGIDVLSSLSVALRSEGDGGVGGIGGGDKCLYELGDATTGLLVDVLSYEFGGGRRGEWTSSSGAGVGTGVGSVLVRPPANWRNYLVRPDFVGGCFSLYHAVRSSCTPSNGGGGGGAGGDEEWKERWMASLRQLVLSLASVTGTVFPNEEQRSAYSAFLLDGTLGMLSHVASDLSQSTVSTAPTTETETSDLCSIVARLVTNFRLETLRTHASFSGLLEGMATVGDLLLRRDTEELRRVGGDVESVEEEGWERRREAIGSLLEASVLMADDRWLNAEGGDGDTAGGDGSGGGGGAVVVGSAREHVRILLATGLSAPLYRSYVTNRIATAKMEEHYLTKVGGDLEETREEIEDAHLEEEMAAAGVLGRLNLGKNVECLVGFLVGGCLPALQAVFEGTGGAGAGVVTPEAAATLEETRILVLCVCHLITDDNTGEAPVIPESVVRSCAPSTNVTAPDTATGPHTASLVAQLVQSITNLAQFQASRLISAPNDPNLSPLLAQTFLRFLTRWAPAYIRPPPFDYDTGGRMDGILDVWNNRDGAASVAVSFCATLCLHYHCCWPTEAKVQEGACGLLDALAKRNGGEDGSGSMSGTKGLLTDSTATEQLATLHVLTADATHHDHNRGTTAEAKAMAEAVGLRPEMVEGYRRLPYAFRAKVLTTLLTTTSGRRGDGDVGRQEKAELIFHRCLEAIQKSLEVLVGSLTAVTVRPYDAHTQERALLCVTLYDGVALASGASSSSSLTTNSSNTLENIPTFLTPSLPHLSGLMAYYASDLSVCEMLLRFFRDYTEQFIALLDRESCLATFRACAELLTGYSIHHCESRAAVVGSTAMGPSIAGGGAEEDAESRLEEEKKYSDVLCAIDLLSNLSSKDFVDVACSTPPVHNSANATTPTLVGLTSVEVTDVVFYGLRQIQPLVTAGLLRFPTLCSRYFALVGFVTDTYPERLGPNRVPTSLFATILETLSYGMSHEDSVVAKDSLRGLASVARTHLEDPSVYAGHCTDPSSPPPLPPIGSPTITSPQLTTPIPSPTPVDLPRLFSTILHRLLTSIVFSSDDLVWGRLETTALALLPLTALAHRDNTLLAVVEEIRSRVEDPAKRERLEGAFERLLRDGVGKARESVCGGGGRASRLRFRKEFEEFVKDVHSTVLVF